jgi:hypothetical protein
MINSLRELVETMLNSLVGDLTLGTGQDMDF